ncbi:hypothetical protein BGZ49_002936 [Haplosporangium sp. Z 27]|nr:hypothetical protein BGZ49_002936 [Haplosporangium sp. Z 27]
MTSPVNLPEMLFYMAPFIALEDLPACIRVCRLWNTSFIPFLWHTVSIQQDWFNNPSFPPLPILEKNAHLVRNLTLKATEGLAPFLQRCNGLKVLVIFGDQIKNKPYDELWDELTCLIKNNPSIEWIVLGLSLLSAPSTPFLQALPKACPNLKRYESSQGKYDSRDQVEALMQAICSLKAVSFRYEYFINIPMSKRWTMPHVFELTLKDARGLSTLSQVDLICQCPSLKHLKWTVGDTLFPTKEFCRRIPAACPKLCQLQMDSCGVADPDDIGKILDSLSRLEMLSLCGNAITKKTFFSLRRHSMALESLDIMYCTHVKSWMTQMILEECPNLTKLLSPLLEMHHAFSGKTWAAVKLMHLEVNFVAAYFDENMSQEQNATFKQLSRLTQLRTLVTGSRGRIHKPGLQFQVKHGMGHLKTLTKLGILNCGSPSQKMSEADVIWIGKHLENLKRVEGIFHVEWSLHLVLAERLREFGIDVPEKDENEMRSFERYGIGAVNSLEYGSEEDESEEYEDEEYEGELYEDGDVIHETYSNEEGVEGYQSGRVAAEYVNLNLGEEEGE